MLKYHCAHKTMSIGVPSFCFGCSYNLLDSRMPFGGDARFLCCCYASNQNHDSVCQQTG